MQPYAEFLQEPFIHTAHCPASYSHMGVHLLSPRGLTLPHNNANIIREYYHRSWIIFRVHYVLSWQLGLNRLSHIIMAGLLLLGHRDPFSSHPARRRAAEGTGMRNGRLGALRLPRCLRLVCSIKGMASCSSADGSCMAVGPLPYRRLQIPSVLTFPIQTTAALHHKRTRNTSIHHVNCTII
jgi:hypothetical protein